MAIGTYATQNSPAHHGTFTVTAVKAQFGQQLLVTVLSWAGGNPDRVRTQWGAILKRNAEGFYDPE